MIRFIRGIIFGCLVAIPLVAGAQSRTNQLDVGSDPRGPAELVVCSQNLNNYGKFENVRAREKGMSQPEFQEKELALVQRFRKAGCDVIALQEVLGSEEAQGLKAAEQLAEALKKVTNRTYEARVGASNDRMLRNGFLVAKDRAEVLNRVSYAKVELPKISEKQKQRLFSRGPLELQINVLPRGESQGRVITLIDFHFKSKSTLGGTDATGLEFEPHRMEMAEALRRIVEIRHQDALASGKTILLLLGDRNSNFDSASAKILEGSLTLRNFQGDAACRLSKRGVPLCQAGQLQPQRFFSVLTTDPQTKLLQGTIRYEKIYSWIDDILMPAESLPVAWTKDGNSGDYDSGVVSDPEEASDHSMVWVRLNW